VLFLKKEDDWEVVGEVAKEELPVQPEEAGATSSNSSTGAVTSTTGAATRVSQSAEQSVPADQADRQEAARREAVSLSQRVGTLTNMLQSFSFTDEAGPPPAWLQTLQAKSSFPRPQ
jgi:hypothetical protein